MKILKLILQTISLVLLTATVMQAMGSDNTSCGELRRDVNTKALIFKHTTYSNEHRCNTKDGQIVDIEVQNSVFVLNNPDTNSTFCDIKYLAKCAPGQRPKPFNCKITIELNKGKQSVPDIAHCD